MDFTPQPDGWDAHMASIEKFFKEERFSTPDFDPHQMVENISAKLVPKNPHDRFDPTPFQNCFETSIEKLRKLQGQINQQTEDLLYECQKADRDYKARLKELNQTFELQKESFVNLDESIDKISKRTVRIGKRLENIELERTNAIVANDLITIVTSLNELADPTLAGFEAIVPLSNPSIETCRKLKNLSLIAVELGDNEATSRARTGIMALHNKLRMDLRQELSQAQKNNEIDTMTRCVSLLAEMFDENEAKLRASFYVYLDGIPLFNKYSWTTSKEEEEFFTMRLKNTTAPLIVDSDEEELEIETIQLDQPTKTTGLGEFSSDLVITDLLPTNKDATEFDYFSALNVFFEDISNTLHKEGKVIDIVFGAMKIVAFEMLVTKIFNHFISPFIEELLLRTKHNLEVYLKTLAHSILKENIFSQPRAAYKEAEVKSIIQFLDTEIKKDLNMQQIEIDTKKKELENLSQTNLTAFINLKILDLQLWNSDPVVRLVPALSHRFLARVGEGIYRCPLITPEDQICENLATIFLSIIDEFGHAYMVKCLEVSIDALTLPQENNQNIKDSLSSASMKNFLEGSILINSNIVQLQNKFFKEIWPEMERRGDRFSQKKCLDAKAILMNKLEDLIITGLSKALSAMNFWVSRLLKNTQLATDFIPETKQSILSRDDNPKTSQSTRACANVCTYLSESYALVGKCLDGKNLEAFWQEFGTQFLQLILNHIKSYKINPAGALVLMMDFRKYKELVATWNVPALKDSFQFLDHIEKLYLMDLEHLKYYISNSPLEQLSPVPNQAHFPAHTDQEELNSYVSQRADFNRSIFSSQ